MSQSVKKVSRTSVTESPLYAKLPSQAAKGYLTKKIDYAAKNPATSKLNASLKQIALSVSLVDDEREEGFKWSYRPEVVFDMLSDDGDDNSIPIPYLSVKGSPKGRRSLNPFRLGSRRPDIIIVKNKNNLWCGRASKDHNGTFHSDNLKRVAEVKFPKDVLNRGQKQAYIQIAGSRANFTLLEVTEYHEEEKNSNSYPIAVPNVVRETYKEYVVEPINEFIIKPITDFGDYISELPNKAIEKLKQEAPWLFEAGRWVEDKATGTWKYISETGRNTYTWTKRQVNAMIDKVSECIDLTVNYLKNIDWWYVLKTSLVIIGTAIVIFVVIRSGSVVAPLAMSIPALASFMTLMGMFSIPAVITNR